MAARDHGTAEEAARQLRALKAVLEETCWRCDGVGSTFIATDSFGKEWRGCCTKCLGSGRVLRVTQSPESAVALDEPAEFWDAKERAYELLRACESRDEIISGQVARIRELEALLNAAILGQRKLEAALGRIAKTNCRNKKCRVEGCAGQIARAALK